ncbi:MAG: TIGR02679 family protein, partial [Solirubrobacteraceae bacterium]
LANGDVDRARALLEHAIALADRLPARGVPLAELAAGVAGDSHALDVGEPLGTIALRLARRIGAPRGLTEDDDARPRDIWASVGVLCDELSAPALVLNLVAATTTATGRALAIHAEAGEPCRLSVRQLLRDPPQFQYSRRPVIYVCENPSVVSSAADRLGARSEPLVCVEGQPRTAARLLLTHLASSGARLAYHGDFDWGGVRIGNVVIGQYGAAPWRFTAADYGATIGGRPLEGNPVDASWDAALAGAMLAAARAVHEEQVMNDLLSDLSAI